MARAWGGVCRVVLAWALVASLFAFAGATAGASAGATRAHQSVVGVAGDHALADAATLVPGDEAQATAARAREGGLDASGGRLLAGADRFATSVVLAERAVDARRRVNVDAGAAAGGGIVVVSGESLVDALSAVPLAAATSSVVVLTQTDAVSDVVAAFVRSHGTGGVSIVGGTDAVSEELASQLVELVAQHAAGGDLAGTAVVERIAGADRYETAVAVARVADALRNQPAANPSNAGHVTAEPSARGSGRWCGEAGRAVVIVNGESLVDGVLAAPVAYAMGLGVLFTRAAALPDAVRAYLAEAGVTRAVLIGNATDISSAVASQLADLGVSTSRIDGTTPAARSVALARTVSACGAASPGEFALLDASQPVDGVTAAALLANGIPPTASTEPITTPQPNKLVPLLAVDRDLPAEIAEHLTQQAATNTDLTLYALGGTQRITPAVMRAALNAASRDRTALTVSQRSTNRASSAARSVPARSATQPSRAPIASATTTTSSTSTTEVPATVAPTTPSSSTTPSTTMSTPLAGAPVTTTTMPAPPAAPTFAVIDAGSDLACGLRTDGSVACWRSISADRWEAPSDTFASLAVGGTHRTCGLRVDGELRCWGSLVVPRFVPSGQFSAIAAGGHFCGVRTDGGTITCWGLNNDFGRLEAPESSVAFEAVAVGGSHSCGLRIDRTITCWGNNQDGQLDIPSGAGVFEAVSAGHHHSCGLRTDGTITCWGSNEDGQIDAPDGQFTQVATGDTFSCGLRHSGRVVCWGSHRGGRLDVPPGEFTWIDANWDGSCGLRVDDSVICWTRVGHVQLHPPIDASVRPSVHATGGKACRARWHDGHADVRDGVFDVLVVFAEFGDARHDPEHLPWSASQAFLSDVEAYLEGQSYGRLDVEFTVVPEWVTIGETYADYLNAELPGSTGSRHLNEVAQWRAVMEAKRRGWDVTNGGERFDSLLVVAPPSHFHGGIAAGAVPVDDAPRRRVHWYGRVELWSSSAPAIRSSSHAGTFPREQPLPSEPLPVLVAAHELLHNLGLDDLYAYRAAPLGLVPSQFAPPSGQANDYVRARYGRMGLWVWWPGTPGSPFHFPAEGPAQPPTGQPVTGATVVDSVRPFADEMLGWSRWRLDWLQPDQIACLAPGPQTVDLAPLAAPDDGTALAIVRVANQQVLVLETRRRIGHDADQLSNDERVYHRRLPEEGVLAYLVEEHRFGGTLPITVLGDDRSGLAPQPPILTLGDTASLEPSQGGPTIEVSVTDDDGTNFTVDITWSTGTDQQSDAFAFKVTRSTSARTPLAPPLGSP